MNKYLIGFLVLLIGVVFVNTQTVDANPSGFLTKVSAAATTTRAYMTAGVGTTTVLFDTQSDGGFTTDSSTLLIQFSASNTSAVLGWRYEFAHEQDQVDWYSENNFTTASTATTSEAVQTAKDYIWRYASSTAATSASNKGMKIVDVPTPTRYVRVVFFVPVGSTPASVWAEFVGKKQR